MSGNEVARKESPGRRPSRFLSVTQKTIDHELNVEKSLAKKLQAAKRKTNIECITKGGGLVITADAATYELLNESMLLYFRGKSNTSDNINVSETYDKSGKNVVSRTIRVDTDYTVNS